jgi:16S rRNA (guanine527-N7)-methyltransferase
MDPALLETLRQAQRFGFFGPGPVEAAATHSMGFVAALAALPPGARVIDLGSGGGLPGLVIASELDTVDLTLVDRRQKRTDFLERAVRRHGWTHVRVRCADVGEVVREVARGLTLPFDAMTARGFGPPEVTLRQAAGVVGVPSLVIISEPPAGDRWPPDLVAELGFSSRREGAVRVFSR